MAHKVALLGRIRNAVYSAVVCGLTSPGSVSVDHELKGVLAVRISNTT